MRRKDREIVNTEEIIDVLTRCNTLNIGFKGKDYPYVVPVSFGFVRDDNDIVIYFHGAKQGLKIDLMDNDSRVCVEGYIFHKVEAVQGGITTLYESIIGFGIAEKVEGDEISVGLKSINSHYGYSDYPIKECKYLSMTAVYKIRLNHITGKRNLPDKV